MIFFGFICWCSSPAVLIQFEAEKNDVDHISIHHLHPGVFCIAPASTANV